MICLPERMSECFQGHTQHRCSFLSREQCLLHGFTQLASSSNPVSDRCTTGYASIPLQVNIHDVAMLKISLVKDADTYAAWRPWNAREYVPAAPSGLSGWAIAIIVCAAVAAAVLIGLLGYIARQWFISNHRRFSRLEMDKKRRTPSGRLIGPVDRSVEAVA